METEEDATLSSSIELGTGIPKNSSDDNKIGGLGLGLMIGGLILFWSILAAIGYYYVVSGRKPPTESNMTDEGNNKADNSSNPENTSAVENTEDKELSQNSQLDEEWA